MNLETTKVRRSFSAAATTYDNAAELQRRVGQALLATIDAEQLKGTVLDLGCGTGFFTSALVNAAPRGALSSLIALDSAWTMLLATRAKLSEQASVQYICADAEQLPFANHTLDYIFSNLALQWCQALAVVFADSKRLLKTEGQLIFSTFGTATLQELKAAWATVDDYHHVNTFYSEAELRLLLAQAGFKNIRGTTTQYVSRYDSVLALMHELKQLGAQSVLAGRNPHTTRKSALQQMIAAYQQHGDDADIAATFEVIMLSATKA